MSSDETYRDELRRELDGAIRSNLVVSRWKNRLCACEISQYKDADLIKDIIPLLWAKEEAVFFETVATVSLLLQQVPIRKLPDLDWELRRSWPLLGGQPSWADYNQNNTSTGYNNPERVRKSDSE